MSEERPALSIVLPMSASWPKPAPALASIVRSAQGIDAEIIVVDGSGSLPETDATDATDARVMVAPSSDPFELRARGINAARGDVIAITEDHCVVDATWCSDVLRAHRGRPDTSVAVGVVHNATSGHRAHRAKFLTTHGHLLRPLDASDLTSLPVSNFSCKRSVIERPVERGWLEQVLMPRAVESGEVALFDAAVWHSQPMSLRSSIVEEFHNGRATAGLALHGQRWRDRRPHVRTALRLMPRSLAALRAAEARGALTHEARRECRLLTATIFAAASAGQLVGVVMGPGRSPDRLGR
jgi:hypothetical protein